MPDEQIITSQRVKIRDTNLGVHCWPKQSQQQPPAALAIIYHGFLAHGRYPTVRYAGDCLAAAGFAVVSGDLRGHGMSEGLPGYLPGGAEQVIQDAVALAEYAQTELYPQTTKIFFVGSSMGGTIALNVAAEWQKKLNASVVVGVVLLAPMLRLSVDSVARTLLRGLSLIIPTWEVIPSSSTSAEQQYRDPVKRKECEDDAHAIHGGKIRVASASTCVELASGVNAAFCATVSCPFLILVADEDVIVNNQGSLDLMEQAASSDKTIKHYPALHGLLCEPSPSVDEIKKDIVEWMQARC